MVDLEDDDDLLFDEEKQESDENETKSNKEKKLSKHEQALKEANDKFLRVQAEMMNLRRRQDEALQDARRYGIEPFVKELLPVMDGFQMGLQAAIDDESRKGLELIYKLFQDLFQKFEIEAIQSEPGSDFDAALHQAMSQQPHDDIAEGQIVSVVQAGYRMHGRLIRPAMVIVSKGTE